MKEVTDDMVDAALAVLDLYLDECATSPENGGDREPVKRAIAAALSAAPDPWQPMETYKGQRVVAYAPFKDGSDALVYTTHDASIPADDELALPTRWMPLPAAPGVERCV